MTEGSEPNRRRPRVLQWVFARAEHTLFCELALNGHRRVYEFRTWRGEGPSSTTVECFLDVARAFQRQCECEAGLIADGWTLQAYHSSSVDDCAA